ncbi:MAG: efflux RND transporter periplasmic adaptor subunit [Thalassotalea sp.]|nr:efflux RND transporter periplasmic adaptor subunit [Thalassotalea sp.]
MHIKRWSIALFIITITIGGLGFFKFQQIQAAIAMAEAFPEPSAAVNTHIAKVSEFQDSYQVTGQIVAKQMVGLQNEHAGIITQVNFEPGQLVTEGELLLSLNVSEEQAQLSSAKASKVLAKQDFKRMTTLVAENKVSQQEYDAADAQLKIAQANIANLESIIAKKQVIAPFTGTVGLENYQKGQFIGANSNITTLIGQDKNIWVDFKLPQTQQQLTIGDTVVVNAISNQTGAQQFTAKVIAKNSAMQANSRHLTYRAEIADGSQLFGHNELVKVTIQLAAQNVVLLPNSAVVRDQFGTYVFLLNQDEQSNYRAKRLAVEAGEHVGEQQIIMSGLNGGELIATDGAFKLREGLLVYPNIVPENSLSAILVSKGEGQG